MSRLFSLFCGAGLLIAGKLCAQPFTSLHDFAGGTDGANPWAALVLSHNTLYGTAYSGGAVDEGLIFAVNTDGSGYTNLHDFTSGPDGANPYAGLVLSGNTLYGTASSGGSAFYGAVFSLKTDGTGFNTIYSFGGGTGGSTPWAGVILSGNTLYGTTQAGGSSGHGLVYSVNLDGTGFKILHDFSAGSDGSTPYGGLVLSANRLYGTAHDGGTSLNGVIFGVNTDGSSFSNLYTFSATTGGNQVNNDGAAPWSQLVLSGSRLYGTAYSGGSSGNGTLFAINTDGTGFSVVHSFTTTSGPMLANIDGANPLAGLTLYGDTLYGTANFGGSYGAGTVFSVSTNGSAFRTLYNFSTITTLNTPNSGGAYPDAGVILSGNTVFGTAYTGGASGYGSVFSVTVPAGPPELTINPVGSNMILTWPTNATGFTLQSTTNLTSPAFWSTVSPAPVVANGQFTVTNPASSSQQYYRLAQ